MQESATQTKTKQLPAAPAKARRKRLGEVLATGEATTLTKAAQLVGYSSKQTAHAALTHPDVQRSYALTLRRQGDRARELETKALDMTGDALEEGQSADPIDKVRLAAGTMQVTAAYRESRGDEAPADPKLNAAAKLRDHARYTIATLLLVQRSPHRLEELLETARTLYSKARKLTDGALFKD